MGIFPGLASGTGRIRRCRRLGRGWLRVGVVVAGLVLGGSLPASVQLLPWSVVPSPIPSGPTYLGSVSCVSAGACMAVGDYGTNSGAFLRNTLIEFWNGTSWSIVPGPNPSHSNSILTGVSCVSADACMASGFYQASQDGVDHTLTESWNGIRWSTVPSPAYKPGSELKSVSCATASACVAVGVDVARNGHDKSLIESWNGTSWSIVPSAGAYNELDGVSCAAAAVCVATGARDFHHGNVGIGGPLIETGAATG